MPPTILRLQTLRIRRGTCTAADALMRLGLDPIQQRYRYDFRNRFGFSDEVDCVFDQLWSADDLGWHDLPTVP